MERREEDGYAYLSGKLLMFCTQLVLQRLDAGSVLLGQRLSSGHTRHHGLVLAAHLGHLGVVCSHAVADVNQLDRTRNNLHIRTTRRHPSVPHVPDNVSQLLLQTWALLTRCASRTCLCLCV